MKIVIETNERFDDEAASGVSALALQMSMIRGVGNVSVLRDDEVVFANYPAENVFGPVNTADASTIAATYTRAHNARQVKVTRRR